MRSDEQAHRAGVQGKCACGFDDRLRNPNPARVAFRNVALNVLQ